MDETLRAAVDLFNSGRFSEFQDALEAVASATRAPSERQFYTQLGRLAEALHQLGNGQLEDAEAILSPALRRLDEFVPRFRGLNVESLREDFRRTLVDLRELRAGRMAELDPARLPRLRVLPE
jgi:hypothetical protein